MRKDYTRQVLPLQYNAESRLSMDGIAWKFRLEATTVQNIVPSSRPHQELADTIFVYVAVLKKMSANLMCLICELFVCMSYNRFLASRVVRYKQITRHKLSLGSVKECLPVC
jgi:hypothetical protein